MPLNYMGWRVEFIGYLAAVLMGLVLGLVGGGGSILTVPILVYLMHLEPGVATGYSLLIVGATAAFGASRYFRLGFVDLKLALLFAIPSVVAVYLTRLLLMPALPEKLLTSPVVIYKDQAIMVLFSLLMMASAFAMLKKVRQTDSEEPLEGGVVTHAPSRWLAIALDGAVVGLITGMLGAGGGFLIVPALVLLVGLPMKNAIGTSLLIIALKSLIGFVGDLQVGIVLDVELIAFMLLATLLGMWASSGVAYRIDAHLLQKLFAVFTAAIASFILIIEFV
ncbi:sulfite exporter TauE/SafE family protein [Planctobacterium marinum]|uniref:Probable membrane transporter protein n=1 Tax=Planctobacterium marinum TaxID=1631968 RepID=A0AA48HM33_9ALTE|nr:UPF0721 transmembrane protein [Planctobacterium marinum]